MIKVCHTFFLSAINFSFGQIFNINVNYSLAGDNLFYKEWGDQKSLDYAFAGEHVSLKQGNYSKGYFHFQRGGM